MFRGFILGIIFTVLAAAAVGYYALSNGLIPANADATPGQIERFIAGTSLQATLDKDAPKESNPMQLTDENLVNGIKLYETHCAICHGTAEGGLLFEGCEPPTLFREFAAECLELAQTTPTRHTLNVPAAIWIHDDALERDFGAKPAVGFGGSCECGRKSAAML
jgi:hypothetical protein